MRPWGLKRTRDGNVDVIALFNACWNVQYNPKVSNLEKTKRIRVIRSAVAAMDYLRFGGR